MQFNDYQELTGKTNEYDKEVMLSAMVSGLAAESGEVNGKYNKFIRGDMDYETFKAYVILEAGDCLWFLSELCTLLEVPLDFCATENIRKLKDRAERGTIKGNGDNR